MISKMPKKIQFRLVKRFDDVATFANWKNQQESSWAIDKSNLAHCSICSPISIDYEHKMRVAYAYCNNDDCYYRGEECPRKYKILTCQKTQKVEFYTFEKHRGVVFNKKLHGMTEKAKEVIEDLISNYDSRPKRIYVQMLRKPYEERIDIMPKLTQVQYYIKNRRYRIGDNNDLDALETYVETLKYKPGVTLDDELFVFGEKFGIGTDDDHFSLGFSSRKLIKRIEDFEVNEKGVYHIDLTYKIVKYNYPLLVFGFTDVQRKFFPMAYMYTSHEQIEDIDHFFKSLCKTCDAFQVVLNPRYMISDASKAIASAIESNFPECQRIMCYFHVMYNIRKQKRKHLPLDKYEKVRGQISDLHNTLTREEYKELLKATTDEWRQDDDLRGFTRYFIDQWILSKFGKWQLFRISPGLALTNSPIESYNNQIKSSFTKGIKHHIKTSLEIFKDVIKYESNVENKFEEEPEVKKYLKKLASGILAKKTLRMIADNLYAYKQYNGNLIQIDTAQKTCSCFKFHDKMICKHLVAACMKDKVRLKGLEYFPRQLVTKRAKKHKKYLDPSIIENNDDVIIQPEEQESIEMERQEDFPIVIQSRGRGRPKKTSTPKQVKAGSGRPKKKSTSKTVKTVKTRPKKTQKATAVQPQEEIIKPKRGRPPKASTALARNETE